MKLTNRNTVLFLIIGGFFFYLLGAVLSSLFIVSIPMDEDWCKRGEKILVAEDQYEFVCVEFKNELQEEIYYHNKRMAERNGRLIWGKLGFGYAICLFIFLIIPKWKGIHIEDKTHVFGMSLILTFVMVIISPKVFSFFLPPPIEWFPDVFREINDVQVEQALRNIKKYL